MQFYEVVFRKGEAGSYTYHYDGEEEIAVGDEVEVPGRNGAGKRRVYVARLRDIPPSYETKPILGKAAPREEQPGA